MLNKTVLYLTAYVYDYGTDSLPSARRDSGINMPEPGILHTFIYILRAPRFCPYAILIYLDHTYASLLSLSLYVPHINFPTPLRHARAPAREKCAKVHMFVRQASGRDCARDVHTG